MKNYFLEVIFYEIYISNENQCVYFRYILFFKYVSKLYNLEFLKLIIKGFS